MGYLKKVCVVIAAYDEEGTIGSLTSRIISVLSSMKEWSWRLIYVIEGDDRTREIVQRFATDLSGIEIYYQKHPSGLGAAFRKGFAAVSVDTDVVITLDADLNHQPEEIPKLIQSLQTWDADMVVGSRKVKESRVEGGAWWKSVLSDTVNRWMRRVTNGHIKDQTSGFRAYRADFLSKLQFKNNGFAFLPELLMEAREKEGLIVEEPILFTSRPVGKSKMKLIPTSFSYLRFFLSRGLNIWTFCAVGLLLTGLILRFFLIYPPHKIHADSDAVLAGLCAMEIMDGNLPVFFPGGTRLSAQSCYVTAFFFKVFGVSRLALTYTSLLFSGLFNLFMYLFFREALGGRLAVLALFLIVLPPLGVLLVTYPPWGYGEIFMNCAGALWLGTLFTRKDSGKWVAFFYGLFVGLALWSSLQSLMILIPQWAWLLYEKKAKPIAGILWAMAGSILGFAPWLLFAAFNGIASMFGGPYLRPSGWELVSANLRYMIGYNIPMLLFNRNAVQLSLFSRQGLQAFLYGLLTLWYVVFLLKPIANLEALGRAMKTYRYRLALMCTLIIVMVMVLYSFSGAGAIRGWTVRYIALIYLALATAWAMGAFVLTSGFRKVVWGVALTAGFLNIPDYPIFHHPKREALKAATIRDQRLLNELKENDIEAVVGNYWRVYSLNFNSRQRIAGIPICPGFDYLGYSDRLKGRKVRWALIADRKSTLMAWAEKAGLKGRFIHVGPDIELFYPSTNPPDLIPAKFLNMVQKAGAAL